MLRFLVIALLAANLAFYGWTQGWLSGVLGLPPEGDREPQRLGTQIDPTALQIRPAVLAQASPAETAASAAAAAAAQPPSAPEASGATLPLPAASQASTPDDGAASGATAAAAAATGAAAAAMATEPTTVCLEGGPFTPAEWRTAESALRNILGDGNWALTTREKPGNWMVFVGPYRSRIIMDKRADQLRQMGVAFEEARSNLPDEYLPGFVFGRYGIETDARALQARLTAQKIKYVRVVPLVRPTTTHTVRIPKASADAQARLLALKPKLGGHTFAPCKDDGRRP
jgi:hypothetical protein